MKKILLLMITAIILSACTNEKVDVSEVEEPESEYVEAEMPERDVSAEVEQLRKEAMEAQNDLYMKMLNNLIVEFDDEYENFDMKVGVELYELIVITPGGMDIAKKNKEMIIETVPEENQEVYGLFYDRVVNLEETFSGLEE